MHLKNILSILLLTITFTIPSKGADISDFAGTVRATLCKEIATNPQIGLFSVTTGAALLMGYPETLYPSLTFIGLGTGTIAWQWAKACYQLITSGQNSKAEANAASATFLLTAIGIFGYSIYKELKA